MGGGGGNPLFEPFYDSMRIAVPLAINANNLEAEKSRTDKLFEANRQKLLSEVAAARDKVAAEGAMKVFQSAMEGIDPNNPSTIMAARAAATNLKKFGVPMPQDETGEIILPGLSYKSKDKANAEKVSPLGQLMKERDLLPLGDPRRKSYDEAIARSGQSPQTTVNMPKIEMGRESDLGKATIERLSKLEPEAQTARSNINRINIMFQSIDKYGEDIVGIEGMFRNTFAPVLKYVPGIDIEKLNAAQMLKLLTTAGVGGIRSEIVGPGQVSNFEQQIMQQVAGGKMAAADGLRQVLAFQKDQLMPKIKSFNSKIDGLSKIPGYEQTGNLYEKINLEEINKKNESKPTLPQQKQEEIIKKSAPPEAIKYLKDHPEFKDQFQAKYGYLP